MDSGDFAWHIDSVAYGARHANPFIGDSGMAGKTANVVCRDLSWCSRWVINWIFDVSLS